MDLELTEQLVRLLLALIGGMAIGMEREWREKAAGFRTMALVSLGSAAFVLVAADGSPEAGARIVAGVTTGVGFLGAGTILRDRGQVLGLTTAAAVWLASAIGVTSATGAYALTLALLLAGLGMLLVAPLVDLSRIRLDSRVYDVRYLAREWDESQLARPFRQAGVRVDVIKISNIDGGMTITWRAYGKQGAHDDVIRALVQSDAVESFSIE